MGRQVKEITILLKYTLVHVLQHVMFMIRANQREKRKRERERERRSRREQEKTGERFS